MPMSTTPIGDMLDTLRPNDLRVSPALAHPSLAAVGVPSNQQILDATNQFYSAHQPVVDGATTNSGSVAQNQPGYVSTLNSYQWKDQQLTQERQDTTGNSIFGGNGGGGIWGPTLDKVKADQLFTTIGVGVNADVQFFIGGTGGLGCVWDIAKREGPKGYGFATGELGLRIAVAFNVQCVVFNKMPSELNLNVYGLGVSLHSGVGFEFRTYFTNLDNLTILGFSIGAGVGVSIGATVFGGHIWNFG
jgi:hypothetical protein